MNIKTLIFYGLIAVVPAYFFNRWMMVKIQPRLSFRRFLLFVFCILALNVAYVTAISFIILRFVWPVK